MLVKMIDGGLVDYYDDAVCYSGCPTCDYGSEYIQYVDIKLTKYSIHFKLNQMYEYAMSQGDIMKLFCGNYEKISNMTEQDFVEFLKSWLSETYGDVVEQFEVKEV